MEKRQKQIFKPSLYQLPVPNTRQIYTKKKILFCNLFFWVAVISAKNHKRQRRKRQSVTDRREKSQTLKVLTAILTLPKLT